MVRNRWFPVVLGLGVALAVSSCGGQDSPRTAVVTDTPAASAETAPAAPSEDPAPTFTPEVDPAEAAASRSAEQEAAAEASRSAETEASLAALTANWQSQDVQYRAMVCHYLITEPEEFLDGMVEAVSSDRGLDREELNTFFEDSCLDLEIEWLETATDQSTYSEVSQRDLALVTKDPDSHAGERYVVFGHISQFDAATGTDAFRAYIAPVQHSRSYDFDEHILAQAGESGLFDDLVQGDIVRMHVQVLGAFTYDTQIGGSTTVPMMRVNVVEAVGFDS